MKSVPVGIELVCGLGSQIDAMRAIVTGQVGMDKKPYVEGVKDFAGEQGEALTVYHVGDIMYAEARDVRPGKILDLPLSRLNSLRRAAFKDVITDSKDKKNLIVNTHATFRWRHGLFSAFDFDQVRALQPDLMVCLVDNIEVVHHRLHQEHDIDATLKDCMVWREEEILATELLSQAILGSSQGFYIVSRGRHEDTRRTLFRLVCRPDMKKVYPSFPMSHVVDLPDVLAEIDHFRAKLAEHFITFDPGDVDEKLLLTVRSRRPRTGRWMNGWTWRRTRSEGPWVGLGRRPARRAGPPTRRGTSRSASGCGRCWTSRGTSTGRSTCGTSS